MMLHCPHSEHSISHQAQTKIVDHSCIEFCQCIGLHIYHPILDYKDAWLSYPLPVLFRGWICMKSDKSPGSSHIWHSSWCLDRYQLLDTLTSKAWGCWYYILDPIEYCHIICWIGLPQNRCWRVRIWSGWPLFLIRSFCSKYWCY